MRWLAAAASLTFVLSGCSGDDKEIVGKDLSPSEQATAPGGPQAGANSFDKAAAVLRAKSALLAIKDFPTGWAATAADPDTPESEEFQQQFADCLNAPVDMFGDEAPDAVSEDSPEFNSPDEDITVSSSVAIAVPGKMGQYFEIISGENVSTCLADAMDAFIQSELKKGGSDIPKGTTFAKPKVGQLSFPSFGDETVPLRVNMSASYEGLKFDFYVDLLYIRSGDNAAYLTFEGTDRPVPVELEQKYAEIATERLAALPGSSSSTPETSTPAPGP